VVECGAKWEKTTTAVRSMENRDVLTIAQAAEYLQFHREKVYRLVREGRLPAARIGKDWRIKRTDIERFLEEAKGWPGGSRRKARKR
jgi:excisionase family DNA binding protein